MIAHEEEIEAMNVFRMCDEKEDREHFRGKGSTAFIFFS
jgi:hypothetical protein